MPSLADLAFLKENLLQCKGYDPKFISPAKNISAEKVIPPALKKKLPAVEGNAKGILHYTGMSVHYHKDRKVPFFSAYNIDGKLKANAAGRPKFRADPRMKAEQQLDFPFYDLRTDITEFEIGHMGSNNEMGRGKDGKLRAFQTFHFTNSVPQAEVLNTGIWKGLESYVIKEAATLKDNKRICVFTGPLLRKDDPPYLEDETFKIPLLFFKVIVFPTTKGLFSTAFMMSHEKRLIENRMIAAAPQGLEAGPFEDFPYRKVFQVDVSFLEKETGLKFTWPGVKKLKVPNVKNQVKKIKSIKNAKEAAKAIKTGSFPESLSGGMSDEERKTAVKNIKKGLLPDAFLSDADLTARELKQKKFKLNMVLPG